MRRARSVALTAALLETTAVVRRQAHGQAGARLVVMPLQHLAMLIEPGDVAAAIVAKMIGRHLPVAGQARFDLFLQGSLVLFEIFHQSAQRCGCITPGKQGRHGAHRYDFSATGFDLAEERERFRPYRERYGVASRL